MNSERGSILAGAIVLSLIMSLAAGSFLITTGFAGQGQQESFDGKKLLIAGETAAQMAVRAMRDMPTADFNGLPEGATGFITPDFPSYTTLQDAPAGAAMGNPLIRASYSKTGGAVTILAWATYGEDTVLIDWKITNAVARVGGPPYSNFTMQNWKDSVLVHRP